MSAYSIVADVLVACAVVRNLKFNILQMSGCCILTAIASTVLHRKILLVLYLLAYLLTVCALFSPDYECISNRQVCISFVHGMQHVLTFWIIKGVLKLFISLVCSLQYEIDN